MAEIAGHGATETSGLLSMTPPALPRDFKSHTEHLAEEEWALNPPEHRIRAWEQAHGLRMPLDPEHPVLDVIAVSTRLTLAQVQEEQRLRAARNTGSAHG
jgi:hypothetical protein